MPGAPILITQDSYQGAVGGSAPAAIAASSAGAMSNMKFIVWLVVIGVVIPALILGGLKVQGLQFVFRRR